MRWAPGRSVRIAGLAAILLLAGLIPGAAGAASSQQADVTLKYACVFPSGPEKVQVPVRIQATFPSSAEAGAKISVQQVSVTMTVPQEAAQELKANSIGGVAGLEVLTAEGQRPSLALWEGLTISDARLPTEGSLTLVAAGAVPSVSVDSGEDVVFSAGALSLKLSPSGSGQGTPAAPIPVSCTPNIGQDTAIVVVPVSGAEHDPVMPTPGAPGSGAPRIQADEERCSDPPPEPEYNPKFIHLFPPVPPDAISGPNPSQGCARFAGKANVNKQKAAAPTAGRVSIIIGQDVYIYNKELPDGRVVPWSQFRHIGMNYIEPTESTFLTFGFMPTTGKMEITQIGNMNLVTEGPGNAQAGEDLANVAQGWAEVSIRLFDVRVNGTPLDVGPNCRSAHPTVLTVTGRSDAPVPYDVELGGRLSGWIDIPEFSGCGVGEDLDRLLTASVSEKRNYVELTQGPVCFTTAVGSFPANPCPPANGFGFTIRPGGEWTSKSGPVTIRPDWILSPESVVECESSTLSGRFRSGTLIGPENLGQITGLTFDSCRGAGALEGVSFTGAAGKLPQTIKLGELGLSESGVLNALIPDLSFQFKSPSCNFEMGGFGTANPADLYHVRATGTIEMPVSLTMSLVDYSAGCPFLFPGVPADYAPSLIYPGIVQDIRYAESFE